MDLRQLEIFVRVSQFGSFSQAALDLSMAQSAVSIAIRKLEVELDTILFDRSSRNVQLTAEGKSLLPRVQCILGQVSDLQQSTGAMRNLLQGELTIVCPSMLATYYLPELLTEFLGVHPGLRASVTQAGTADVEHMLLAGVIEIGVTTSAAAEGSPGLHSVPLINEQIVVVVAEDHPWARRRFLKIADLHEAPMVVYESGYSIRNLLDAICAEHGVAPRYRVQTNFLPLLTRMVKKGLGAGIGLQLMTQEESGIVGIPLSPRIHLTMTLAKRRGRSISRANQGFFDWVRDKA